MQRAPAIFVLRSMVKLLLGWLLLLVVCWPLALLALVLYPFVWLLLLPFRLVGIVVQGVFELLRSDHPAAGSSRGDAGLVSRDGLRGAPSNVRATMANTDSRVTIHMAASLDGFIARKDGRVDWLETSDEFAGGDTMDPGFVEAFLKTIDCYVMGSRTYETALEF